MNEKQEPAITEMIELVREVKIRVDAKPPKAQRAKTRRSRIRRAVRKLLK